MNYSTECETIDFTSLDTEAYDVAGKHVHYHHNPVALKQYGLASEKVNAPETVFGMGDGYQPRNALAVGIGVVVHCKDATNHVLIDVDTEGV